MRTTQERAIMLVGMRRAADAFYQQAFHIGCHPFIRFAEPMNEYIKICEAAHNDGIDFTDYSNLKFVFPSAVETNG